MDRSDVSYRYGDIFSDREPDIPSAIVSSKVQKGEKFNTIIYLIIWEQKNEEVILPSWMAAEFVEYLFPE